MGNRPCTRSLRLTRLHEKVWTTAMCSELRSLRKSIAAYAKTFDARAITSAEADDVVRLCARIEASAASIKALAAARAAECRNWERNGYRSASDQLADQAGMSPSAAKRALETGQRMADQPEVAAAALAGELSSEQAAAVSDGAAADPGKATELIEKAKRVSMSELNEEVARVKAAGADREEVRRARHARRSLRRWNDRDGAALAHLYGHPEDVATLWRALDPIRRRLNILRRESATTRDSLDALDYDALITLASVAVGRDGELGLSDLVDLGLFPELDAVLRARAVPGTLFASTRGEDPPEPPRGTAAGNRRRAKKLAGRPIRVEIRVDLEALLGGFPREGELCEIAGYGPVAVSVVKRLIETESPFIVGILTKGKAVTGVYHMGRRPNAHQQSALDFLYPMCAVEGCSCRAGLDYEHRLGFRETRITGFDFLDRLCKFHHRKKTHEGWSLVDGVGKRPFVPAGDPRHPRFNAGSDVRLGAGLDDGPDPPEFEDTG